MQFLGTLGIDPKLLVAQLVNFAILLWLLNKFLYKPIVSQIEKEEKEIHQAEQDKAVLEQNKLKEDAEEAKRVADIRQKSQKILAEAEEIARKIREDAYKKAAEDAAQFVEQAKKKTQHQLDSTKENKHDIAKVLAKRVVEKNLKKERDVVSRAFFQLLLHDVAHMELAKKAVPAGKKLRAVLESSFDVSKSETEQLHKALIELTKHDDIDLSVKQNADLVEGVRLQFAGKVIEESILTHIAS